MASTQQKVHDLIQVASSACAEIEGQSAHGLAADSPAIASVQTTMIMSIASEHGIEITLADAAELLHTLSQGMQKHHVVFNRQAVVGWLPGIDNVDDGSSAAALTEAVGWAANSHFAQSAAESRSSSDR